MLRCGGTAKRRRKRRRRVWLTATEAPNNFKTSRAAPAKPPHFSVPAATFIVLMQNDIRRASCRARVRCSNFSAKSVQPKFT